MLYPANNTLHIFYLGKKKSVRILTNINVYQKERKFFYVLGEIYSKPTKYFHLLCMPQASNTQLPHLYPKSQIFPNIIQAYLELPNFLNSNCSFNMHDNTTFRFLQLEYYYIYSSQKSQRLPIIFQFTYKSLYILFLHFDSLNCYQDLLDMLSFSKIMLLNH